MNDHLILYGLLKDAEYTRKVLPHLKDEYFESIDSKYLFSAIGAYINKYNECPSKESILVDLSNLNTLSESSFKSVCSLMEELYNIPEQNTEWLVKNTEKYCQDKAIYNAIYQSIKILDDKNSKVERNSIPAILTEALGVGFNNDVGHSLIDDAEERYEFYHLKEHKIPFDISQFNKITGGGISRKTLSVVMAGTGVGKTMFMCHCATAAFLSGYNVLYITNEMAEERIAERIDANMMDITVDDLKLLPKDYFQRKINQIKNKTTGKLVIKEYPTATANVIHYRNLLEELRIKKDFKPDIIFVDYLNICTSSRLKFGANVGSFQYIKSIAEELRGLAIEYNIPIFSATQVNREGYKSSDFDMDDTSESFGLPYTLDFMFALISNPELAAMNQIMVKQLKNRYSDPDQCKRFVIGVDKPKMRFFELEDNAGISMDKPIMDQTTFGEREIDVFTSTKNKKKLNKFNFQ